MATHFHSPSSCEQKQEVGEVDAASPAFFENAYNGDRLLNRKHIHTSLEVIACAYSVNIVVEPVDLDCPLRLTMSLIESKWKSCILDELRSGEAMRPSEIHKCLSEAAPRVLDIQLKEMVGDGLVVKTIYPELPPRSEYRITELGKSLLPIIDLMFRWGEEHFEVFEKKYKQKQ